MKKVDGMRFYEFFNSDRGASAVEMALILPILVMLLLGIFQFGLVFNSYLAITHAAREGARMAAVGDYDKAEVIERAYPVEPDSVSIEYPNGQEQGEPVVVTVDEAFPLEIPFFTAVTIPLSSSATMRLES